jgi:type IV pilus assembly protein PilB
MKEKIQELENKVQSQEDFKKRITWTFAIVVTVALILEYAIKGRASDIHIEAQEGKTRVRYRIDGLLQEKLTLPKTIHDSLVSRIKILSGMKIDEKRAPQDGRFNFKMAEEEVDLRVSTLPTAFGEKVVLRLLKKTGGIPSLNELGLSGPQLKILTDAVTRPYGIVLVTGPTGPSSFNEGIPPVFLSKRSTTFSPNAVGSVDTRRSTSSSAILKLNRPS